MDKKDVVKNSTISTIIEYVKERPFDQKPKSEQRQDRLTDLIFSILIFSVTYWFSFIAFNYFLQTVGGVGGYAYTNKPFNFINNHPELYWVTSLLGWAPNQNIQVEGFYDFNYYYIPYVQNFVRGWNPFTGGNTAPILPDQMHGYVYGPFYIFFISVGSLFFNMGAVESLVYSNVISYSLISVMVYLLAKRVTGNIIALIVALFHSVLPVNLVYQIFYGFNTPQMTLLFLISVWFFMRHNDSLAIFFLGMAFLTKQFPLLIAMPILMLLVRRYGWLRGIMFFIEFIIYSLLLSIPFILYDPTSYVYRLFLAGGTQKGVPTIASLRNPSNAGISVTIVGSAVASGDLFLAQVLSIIVSSLVLFFLTLFVISWSAFSAYRYLEINPQHYYRFIALFFFIAHGIIGRGLYKYYDPFLLPLLILALIPFNPNGSLNLRLGATIQANFRTLISSKTRAEPLSLKYVVFLISSVFLFIYQFIFLEWMAKLVFGKDPIRIIWLISASFLVIACILKPNSKFDIKDFLNLKNFSVEANNKNTSNSHSTGSSQDDLTESEDMILAFKHLIVNGINVILLVGIFLTIYLQVAHDTTELFKNYGFLLWMSILGTISLLNLEIVKSNIFLYPELPRDPPSHAVQGVEVFSFFSTLGLSLGFVDLKIFNFISDPNLVFLNNFAKNTILIAFSLFVTFVISRIIAYALGTNVNHVTKRARHYSHQLKSLSVGTLISIGVFITQLLTRLYFKQNFRSEFFFFVSMAILTGSIVLSGLLLKYVSHSNKIARTVIYDPKVNIIDILRIVILGSVVWFFNILVFDVDRLMNPALIFYFGIVLMAYMGEEYWSAYIRMPIRVLKTIF